MLSQTQISEIRHFLHRLQGKEVRVEISSRINIAMRLSFAVTVLIVTIIVSLAAMAMFQFSLIQWRQKPIVVMLALSP